MVVDFGYRDDIMHIYMFANSVNRGLILVIPLFRIVKRRSHWFCTRKASLALSNTRIRSLLLKSSVPKE